MPDQADAPRDIAWYVGDLIARGVRRVHVLAWRDLDDPDAGGSEAHAEEFMRRWASHGLDVVHRTSAAAGLPAEAHRSGYRIVRRGSRYTVFPRAIAAELTGRDGRFDALVEVWNGVPWFSPVWCRKPHIAMLHHVHDRMWDQLLPGPLAAGGRFLEKRFAPPFYRRTLTVTPSEATRQELIELGFRPERVLAFPNGVDPVFAPGGRRSAHPSLIAVGRLAPVKRFEVVIDAAVIARRTVPNLSLEIVGDGPIRDELQARIDAVGAHDWIRLVGRVAHPDLVAMYQRAWLVVSGSLAEGWGLSLTEAAACGTPAVATDIRGHHSSVVDGVTGVLVPPERLGSAIAEVLDDHARRQALADAALARARTLTWESSALGVTSTLHAAVVARAG